MDTKTLDREFAGKVAFVTGAATGIGETVARRLARAGARVLVGGHDGMALGAPVTPAWCGGWKSRRERSNEPS